MDLGFSTSGPELVNPLSTDAAYDVERPFSPKAAVQTEENQQYPAAPMGQNQPLATLEDTRIEETIISFRQPLLEALSVTKPDLPSSLCRLHGDVTWIQLRFCNLLITKAAWPKYDWRFFAHVPISPFLREACLGQ